jgi:hypothetical protein
MFLPLLNTTAEVLCFELCMCSLQLFHTFLTPTNLRWHWTEGDFMTSRLKNNCRLQLPSTKHSIYANVFNNGTNTGFTASSCKELLQREQHGMAGKYHYHREYNNPEISWSCLIKYTHSIHILKIFKITGSERILHVPEHKIMVFLLYYLKSKRYS